MPTAASRLMPTLRRVVLAGAGADRSDGQLLTAFVADRDADAFASLVRRHGPMVLGVCQRIVRDRTVADDAFQAVFIVLARRAGAVKPREQVGNWLYGVAYRTALKARMVLARRRSREKQVDVMPEPPVSHPIATDWADLQPIIDEELARLPAKLRLPVVLCDLEGRPQRDVAKHLGIPPATLATRLASARRTLATRLTRRGVTLSGGALAGLLSTNGAARAVPHALAQGATRAAEALAGGGTVSTLVSAQAVQLSEGVMRMMLLTKLKAVAVTALTALTLTGGLGLGLMPAYGHSREAAAPAGGPAARPAEVPAVAINEFISEKLREVKLDPKAEVDDATYLRRLSLDIRGLLPTDVETTFFISDDDTEKRAKVVVWMVEDADVKVYAAKKLGIEPKRILLARVVDGDAKLPRRLVLVIDAADGDGKPQALAFSPDGKRLAIELKVDEKVKDEKTFKPLAVPLMLDLDANVQGPYTLLRRARVATPGDNKPVEGQPLRLNLNVTDPNAKPGDSVWMTVDGDDPRVRKTIVRKAVKGGAVMDGDQDGKADFLWVEDLTDVDVGLVQVSTSSDAEFLQRVVREARGGEPTALEQKYFAEDKDPKKREKLLDALLKDPAVARKLGGAWKKKMLSAPPAPDVWRNLQYHVEPRKEGFFRVAPLNPETGKWMFDFQVEPKKDGARKDDARKEGAKFKVVPIKPKSEKWHFEMKFDPKKEGEGPWRFAFPGDPKSGAKAKEGVFEWKFETPHSSAAPKPPARGQETAPAPKALRVQLASPPAVPTPPTPPTPASPTHRADRLDKIVGELLAAKKSDADVLDGITLVVLGRLPTEPEKRLTLGLVAKSADRKAAWLEVARALAGTAEGHERSSTTGTLKRATERTIELTGRATGGEGQTFELHITPDGKAELKSRPPEKK